MVVKEALLESELLKVKQFLNENNLSIDRFIDKTFYIEDESLEVVGTISCYNNIIKCLAVRVEDQGNNVSSLLISEMINYFSRNNINSYFVYTKPNNLQLFMSFGFRKIVQSENVLFLEGGTSKIEEEINKLKTKITMTIGDVNDNLDIASIVINANPITNGHIFLIEEASKVHDYVFVFLLEEDKSFFSFKERYALAFLALNRFDNVVLLPSTNYIISNLTFPDYFLKDKNTVTVENAYIDGLIFKNYFMSKLFIKKRYVGEEENERMKMYNNTLKEVLGSSLVIVKRIKQNNTVVSASVVRNLLSKNQIDEALTFIPTECQFILKEIVKEKWNKV